MTLDICIFESIVANVICEQLCKEKCVVHLPLRTANITLHTIGYLCPVAMRFVCLFQLNQ